MNQYLVVYRSSVPASDQMVRASPEQAKAGMDAWMTWAQNAGSAIVDLGNPLGHSVRLEGGENVGNGDAQIAGFSILQAESTAALVEVLKGHPHFMAPGASIDVFEFLPMPGM